jgi:hypothetical protein
LTSGLASTNITQLTYYFGFNCLVSELEISDYVLDDDNNDVFKNKHIKNPNIIFDDRLITNIKLNDNIDNLDLRLYPIYLILKTNNSYQLLKFDSSTDIKIYLLNILNILSEQVLQVLPKEFDDSHIELDDEYHNWTIYYEKFIKEII